MKYKIGLVIIGVPLFLVFYEHLFRIFAMRGSEFSLLGLIYNVLVCIAIFCVLSGNFDKLEKNRKLYNKNKKEQEEKNSLIRQQESLKRFAKEYSDDKTKK